MLIGLIGKPSAGKSTFFKASTLAEVEIASYPFTTINKNEGVGFVRVECPEKELKLKCKPNHGYCIRGQRFVPIKLIDVAGLVPEAHKGKGKGNQFLDDLREADLLIHILDASGKIDETGNPTENYNPARDIEFLENEIDMWIFNILEKNWKNLVRKSKTGGEKLGYEIAQQLSGLKINENHIKAVMKKLELSERGDAWSSSHLLEFAKEIRTISKPIIIAANKADIEEAKKNIERLKNEFPDKIMIPCSADSELALREAMRAGLIDYIPGDKGFEIKNQLNEAQKRALETINKNVLSIYGSTGVQSCLNKAVFSFLNYIVVYPVENENHLTDKNNNILPDALLLKQNSTCLDLAYAIHTDIGNAFIGAIDCKTKKKLGKNSILQNNDIIKILTK